MKEISVVIPVYNSETSLVELMDRLRSILSSMKKSYEIIFVNDASTDKSYTILKKIREQNEHVVVVNLSRNYGQQNALMCGFNLCSGKYVITIDDDLQNVPEDIPQMYKKIQEGFDAVFGTYVKKRHSVVKNMGSFIIRKINNSLFLKGFDDIKFSSFRIIRKSVIDEIKLISTPFPYISGLILTVSNRIANIEVAHYPRKYGRSSYTFKKLIFLSLNLLINYSAIPLRFVGVAGLLVSFLSILGGGIFIIRKLILGVAPAGWTSLFVLISFYNALIFLIFYILSEYISRILREVSNYKQYTVREVLK